MQSVDYWDGPGISASIYTPGDIIRVLNVLVAEGGMWCCETGKPCLMNDSCMGSQMSPTFSPTSHKPLSSVDG